MTSRVIPAPRIEVILRAHTVNPAEVIAESARKNYGGHSARGEKARKNANKLVDSLTSHGHTAPLEHAVFTFDLFNVSRSLTHQFVRHRIATYSQESQHYITYDLLRVVVPAAIDNSRRLDLFIHACRSAFAAYRTLLDLGVSNYEARAVLPNATASAITVTMNARSLINFFAQRCCFRNTPEIREVAWKMLILCQEELPAVFDRAGPSCRWYGFCPEGDKSCGRPVVKGSFGEGVQ